MRSTTLPGVPRRKGKIKSKETAKLKIEYSFTTAFNEEAKIDTRCISRVNKETML